jgi:large subunit ribosomal protein L22
MGYSFNLSGDFIKAQGKDINASYKDLAIVCSAVRYMKAANALDLIDSVVAMQRPIPFNRYNKYMGSRHELGGRKGAYPVKAAKEVRKVIVNALANAENKGVEAPEELLIIHASANKTETMRRQPSKGSLAWGRGMYGRAALMHSDIEFARVEIVLGKETEPKLSDNMKYFIKKKRAEAMMALKQRKPQPVKKPQKKTDKKAEKKKEEKAKVPAK